MSVVTRRRRSELIYEYGGITLGMPLSASAYHSLFEADPDGLVLLDSPAGVIRECNQQFCDVVGGQRDDLVGRAFSTLTSSDRDVASALAGDNTGADTLVVRLTTGVGDVSPVELRTSTVEMDEGDDAGEFVLARVRRVSSGTHEPELERKSKVVDEAPIGITISDPAQEDNPLIYANETFHDLTGYATEEIVGRNCRFLQGEKTDPDAVAAMREAIDAEEPVTVELCNYRKDGSEFYNRITVAPLYDDAGALANYVGFQYDVTEREQYRQKLELSHNMLKTVPSGVFRTDPTPDGTFEYVNPALVSLLEATSADQLRGRRVAEFYVNPTARSDLMEALRNTDGDQVRREVQLETLDGATKDVIVTASLSEDAAGNEHVHKVVQDIAERKEREQALERYERLVTNLPIGVYQHTPGPDDEFTLLNDAMVDIFDADSKAHLREQHVRDLYVDPSEYSEFADRLLDQGFVQDEEFELETLAGETIWGAVTAIAREVGGETVIDGVVQDITERKRFQQRLKEQRDNLDVLNQMLRHDIRNDLQLVTAYADFLTDHVDDEGREHIETIQEGAMHAVELTRTARSIADVMLTTDGERQQVDLANALETELDDVRSTYSEAVITVSGTVPSVAVWANEMLGSVFRNLLTNAVQHNDTEIPKVEVSTTEREETVAVRIADNGPGVPDSQKDTIFGRGEKGLESEGTGMGLYLVKTLVEMYGGDVAIEDKTAGNAGDDSDGAVFVVELPKVG